MSLNMEENNGCETCEFRDNLKKLREIDFFSQFPLEPLKLLAYLCQREVFQPGDELFTQGEDDGLAFYVFSGTLRAVHDTGEKRLDIRQFAKGDLVGSLAMFGGSPRLYSLVAQTKAECLFITRDKFTRVLDQFPDVKTKVFQGLVKAIRTWDLAALSRLGETSGPPGALAGVSLI